MNSALIAVIVEQYNKIVEIESQISGLNQVLEAHAISGIGELNQYLMDNEIGIVGDMTAKAALDHIKNLESRIATLDEANTEILGDYLVAAERARELEIELNAQPDVVSPEDAYLGDFRVLKTAIEIVSYAIKSEPNDYKQEICRQAVRLIKSFTENVRLWDGLDSLEPYRWSSVGSGVHHLIDREWKKWV
jgi:predicted MPP superfamily phosphohydrolase